MLGFGRIVGRVARLLLRWTLAWCNPRPPRGLCDDRADLGSGADTEVPADVPAPEERAEALLIRHLTPEQRATYRRHGWFRMTGRDGSYWTIYRERGSTNVVRTTSHGTETYCTYLRDTPRADTLLAQKLCIEATGGRGLPRMCGGTEPRDAHLFEVSPSKRPTDV